MAPGFLRTFLMLGAGPIVWAVHFLLVYALTGIICARPGWQSQWLGISVSSWLVAGPSVTAAAVLMLAWLHLRRPRQEGESRFVRRTAMALVWLALLAIVWETLPLLLVPHCI